jgi:hypothetical protein
MKNWSLNPALHSFISSTIEVTLATLDVNGAELMLMFVKVKVLHQIVSKPHNHLQCYCKSTVK